MSMNVFYETKHNDFVGWDDRGGKIRLSCSPHLHRELELVFLLEGETVAYADSIRCTLHAGDIFLTFPNQIHYYESSGREKFKICTVKPDLMPELMDLFTMAVPESPAIRGGAFQEEPLRLMEQLNALDQNTPVPYAASLRHGYLLALFSRLLGMMTVTKVPVGDSGALRAIVSFCTRNFSENLSLSLLEEKLHLNKYYISHLFSGKLGLRFNDYVNSLRISEACRYLLNSDHSMTEISELVGFNTLRTFNRAFVKQTGISPTEYRRNDTISSVPAEHKEVRTDESDQGCDTFFDGCR